MGPQPYAPTIDAMQAHAAAIRAAGAPESVWLLQHQAIYTGGTSAHDDDLLKPGPFQWCVTGAAANGHIMAPVNGWPMSCWTLPRAGMMCARWCMGWKAG